MLISISVCQYFLFICLAFYIGKTSASVFFKRQFLKVPIPALWELQGHVRHWVARHPWRVWFIKRKGKGLCFAVSDSCWSDNYFPSWKTTLTPFLVFVHSPCPSLGSVTHCRIISWEISQSTLWIKATNLLRAVLEMCPRGPSKKRESPSYSTMAAHVTWHHTTWPESTSCSVLVAEATGLWRYMWRKGLTRNLCLSVCFLKNWFCVYRYFACMYVWAQHVYSTLRDQKRTLDSPGSGVKGLQL